MWFLLVFSLEHHVEEIMEIKKYCQQNNVNGKKNITCILIKKQTCKTDLTVFWSNVWNVSRKFSHCKKVNNTNLKTNNNVVVKSRFPMNRTILVLYVLFFRHPWSDGNDWIHCLKSPNIFLSIACIFDWKQYNIFY